MSTVPSTSFINVRVTVTPSTKPGQKYDVVCDPDKVPVTAPDTVINYQIVEPASGIYFSGASFSPDQNHQLAGPALGESKKIITINDANTVAIKMHVNLKFKDKDGGDFGHDPEVENVPQ